MTSNPIVSIDSMQRIVMPEEKGVFFGIAAIMNVVDSQNEMIMQNAFEKTLKDRPISRPLQYMHFDDQPIGHIEVMVKENKLLAKGFFDLDMNENKEPINPLAWRIYNILQKKKDNPPFSLSIGGRIIKSKYEDNIRRILELNLHEVSIVNYPAQIGAKISVIKNDKPVRPQMHSLEPRKHLDHLQKIYETIKKIQRGET